MHSPKKKRPARWSGSIHLKFVELCEQEINKGNRPGSHFNAEGWANIIQVFKDATGLNFERKQMKNHWDSMKSEWKVYRSLISGEPYLKWDSRNRIIADDEWWESKIEENSQYRKFKDKDLSLLRYRYDALFSNVAVMSEVERAPLQVQGESVSDDRAVRREGTSAAGEEEDSEDSNEVWGTDGIGFQVPPVAVTDNPPSTSKSQRSNRTTSNGRKRKKPAATATIMREDIHSLVNLMKDKNTASNASDGGPPIPSIKHCMDILRNLPSIEVRSALWNYASTFLMKPESREVFFNQPDDEARYSWLKWNYSTFVSGRR